MIRKEENFDLSGMNTFRMDVSCACFVEYDSTKDLETLDFDALPQPVLHIGGGSNLLFTGNFPGTVLHSAVKFVKYIDLGLEDVFMAVGAGVTFDDFCAKACEAGYWGAENLSLIPGEVGAAAVQNIGAYGVEVKDIISGVVCYDRQTGQKVTLRVPECAYGYRDSLFKHSEGRYIVTSVLFHLTRKYSPKLEYKGVREALGIGADENPEGLTPLQVREAIIGVRRVKLPDPQDLGSAGSYFKNPVVNAVQFAHVIDVARELFGPQVTVPHFILEGGMIKVPAAWLIDKSGLKGASRGGASTYEKQPLVIVNASGHATPQDVLELENHIIGTVRERFGVTLSPEVEHITE